MSKLLSRLPALAPFQGTGMLNVADCRHAVVTLGEGIVPALVDEILRVANPNQEDYIKAEGKAVTVNMSITCCRPQDQVMGLDKSTLIHRWRCDASQALKVAYQRCLQCHVLLEVIIIDLLND